MYERFRTISILIENIMFYSYYKLQFNLQSGYKTPESQRFTEVRKSSYPLPVFLPECEIIWAVRCFKKKN